MSRLVAVKDRPDHEECGDLMELSWNSQGLRVAKCPRCNNDLELTHGESQDARTQATCYGSVIKVKP